MNMNITAYPCLVIDPEFERAIPPLTEDEFSRLEENILEEGVVLNPIITWNGVIVDGHNRYRIVLAHPEIPFTTLERDFANRHEAIAWICKNQLGRRNLTPEQRKYLIGTQYNAEKLAHAFRGNQYQRMETEPRGNTSDRLALEHRTSARFVRRAEQYVKGIEAAEEVCPGIRDKLLTRAIRATHQEVAAICQMPFCDRRDYVEGLMTNPKPNRAEEADDIAKPTIPQEQNPEPEELVSMLIRAYADFTAYWDSCMVKYHALLAEPQYQEQILALKHRCLKYLEQYM